MSIWHKVIQKNETGRFFVKTPRGLVAGALSFYYYTFIKWLTIFNINVQVQHHGNRLKIMIEWDLPQECKVWLIYENQCNVWKIQTILTILIFAEKHLTKFSIYSWQNWCQEIRCKRNVDMRSTYMTNSQLTSYSKWKANSFIYNTETK